MRSLALAALASVALTTIPAAASMPAQPGRLVFDMLRNGHQDGRHVIVAAPGPAGLNVSSQLSVRVQAGPITLFSYDQNCREVWAQGALATLNCSTVKDGQRLNVSARRVGQGIVVNGASGQHVVPLIAEPTTWWVKPPLQGVIMINTENGAPLQARVLRLGRQLIPVNGRMVLADHIRVQGTLAADLWYDLSGHWIAGSADVRGQHIEYRLVSPLAAAPTPPART